MTDISADAKRSTPVKRPGLLSGLEVLDLSVFLPGPFATQMLLDLGASVTKVEPPGGDPGRDMPGGLFASVNRGKRSIELDLKDRGDRESCYQLVLGADVVVVGFRPGVSERLGVGYEQLARIKEDVVYCALTGFGSTGPDRLRPGHDVTYLAAAGALAVDGSWRQGRPARPGIPLSDLSGSSFAAVSILAALRHRDATGEGAFLDVSIVDSALAFTTTRVDPTHVTESSGRLHLLPTNDVYRTQDDRFVSVGAVEGHFWERLRAVLSDEVPEITQARFDAEHRQKHGDELVSLLERAFLRRDAQTWVAELQAEDVPIELVRDVKEASIAAGARARLVAGRPAPIGVNGVLAGTEAPVPMLDADREHLLHERGI